MPRRTRSARSRNCAPPTPPPPRADATIWTGTKSPTWATDTRSFDTYLEAMHAMRMETEGAETPISRYLRDIETLQHLKADDPLPENIRELIGTDPQQNDNAHE